MTRSTDTGETPPEGRDVVAGNRDFAHMKKEHQTDKPARSMPTVSFLLLTLAVIVASVGAVTWAIVRPDPRTIEIIVPTPGPITVHVTGSVPNPGVYTLPPGSRVAEAVDAAGGLTGESHINLAAPLRDGQQLVILEAAVAPTSDPLQSNGDPGPQASNLLLDLNTASAVQLEQLPGIGPTRAAAIVEFRERNGPVLFVDDLTSIDGIGAGTVDALRSMVIQP